MEFWETIAARHSVRDFDGQSIERSVIERILAAAQQAPSSTNEQPWRFAVARGESRIELGAIVAQSTVHLSEYMDVLGPDRYEAAVAWYSSLGNAPVLVVVSAPRSSVEFEAMNRHLSVGAAIENLLLAATNEGLGACNVTFSYWVKDDLSAMLGLSDAEEVVSIIALGHPSDVPPASPPVKPDDTVWLD